MNRRLLLVFFVILFIAAFLRLYRIDSIPPGVNRDEASIGYTAYSLLKTGADEYGRHLPISFESFGDWKLPLYIYTVVPFVKMFGLSELAVRLPSALFGILTVGLTFFLINLLFKNRKLALLSMFLMAISPWSIHLSRVESESNAAVFFVILGTLCFLAGLKGKSYLLILSAIFFALTYFTYAGNHLFTTLLIVGLLFFYRKEIVVERTSFIAAFLFLGLSAIIFSQTLFGADRTKLAGISIFGDPSVVHAKIEIPRLEHATPNSFLARLTHNRVVFVFERIGGNYISAFSSQFLFIKGGENQAHNIENSGNMYLVEAPFLFLGLAYLMFFRRGKERNLVLWWFFIAPIASSITKDAPHTNRMFTIFPILPLVIGLGLYWLITDLVRQKWRKLLIFAIAILLVVNLLIYLDRYYLHFPRNEASNWGFGYKKLADLISKPEFSSRKIIMSRPHYSPYIYLLFYTKYDPKLYQKTAVRYPMSMDGFTDVKGFGQRYEFININWEKDMSRKNLLIVDWTSDVPESLRFVYEPRYEIVLPDYKFMFTVLETK